MKEKGRGRKREKNEGIRNGEGGEAKWDAKEENQVSGNFRQPCSAFLLVVIPTQEG